MPVRLKLKKYSYEVQMVNKEWFIFNLLNFNYIIADKNLSQTNISNLDKSTQENLLELGFITKVKEESVLKNARLALTDGIMDVKFSIKDSNQMDPMIILDKFSKVTNNYDFFRMSDSFRFLAEDMEDIRQIFDNIPERDDMFSTGLAKIRISIPNSQNQSDVVSYVAEVLHANGVELVNAF